MKIFNGITGACALAVIDQITKIMVLANIPEYSEIPFIPGFLSLTYIKNDGAIWGILKGGRWIFLSIAVVIMGFLIHYYKKLGDDILSRWIKLSFILIAGGAIGNSWDRFFRKFVVDFIKTDFMDFPIFNFADICVVTGTGLLTFLLIFFVKEEHGII